MNRSPKKRPSPILSSRTWEEDPDSITKKGCSGNTKAVGVAERNAGLVILIEQPHDPGRKSNVGGYLTALFVPDSMEDSKLFNGDFAKGKRFKESYFQTQVRSATDKTKSMLFYAKSLIPLDALTEVEQKELSVKFPEIAQLY